LEEEVKIEKGSGIVQLKEVEVTTGEEGEETVQDLAGAKLFECAPCPPPPPPPPLLSLHPLPYPSGLLLPPPPPPFEPFRLLARVSPPRPGQVLQGQRDGVGHLARPRHGGAAP